MTYRKLYMGWLLSAILIFMGLMSSVGQANAAIVIVNDWRSTWAVQADFVGNTPNVVLTVTVERDTGSGWFLYGEEMQRLECGVDGGVVLVDDTAVFDGTGHIRCAMPSIQRMVYKMTGGQYTPEASCQCKGNPMIGAKVQLDPNTTGSDWQNPLVAREAVAGTDMALSAVVPAFSTLPQAALNFVVAAEIAQSNAFIANGVPNTFLATYIDVGGLHQAEFVANAVNPGTGAPPVGNLSVSNRATTLYIGYSPATGETLHGTLSSLDLDPGCYGTG